jgi:hypothetical protein
MFWETCAPGHGKGPWDGLTAVLKCFLRRHDLHAYERKFEVPPNTSVLHSPSFASASSFAVISH